MSFTRRRILKTAGAALVTSVAPLCVADALAAQKNVAVIEPRIHTWDNGGENKYLYDPRRPLLEHHIKWGPRVDDAFLEEIEKERYTIERIEEGRTFHGMYFGDDRPWVGTVIAQVSTWDSGDSRELKVYFVNGVEYGDGLLDALYAFPLVCCNPCWEVKKGKQPLCIPRPEDNHLYPVYPAA